MDAAESTVDRSTFDRIVDINDGLRTERDEARAALAVANNKLVTGRELRPGYVAIPERVWCDVAAVLQCQPYKNVEPMMTVLDEQGLLPEYL